MTQRVAKEIPLSSLTIRKYEKPHTEDKRMLIKRFCLSIGLLEPGDSRDIIIDILTVFIEKAKQRQALTINELIEETKTIRRKLSLSEKGCSEPNIRRQVLRLKNAGLVEKQKNKYRIKEFLSTEELTQDVVKKKADEIIERVLLYAKAIDNI